MEHGTITNKLAEKVAKWLMKDIKLNAGQLPADIRSSRKCPP